MSLAARQGKPIVEGRGIVNACLRVIDAEGDGAMAVELPDGRSESNEVLEALRLRAVNARELGYPVVDIAAILGVREETVSRWCVKYEEGGVEALPGDRTGRPLGSGRRLDPDQEQAIQDLIDTKLPMIWGSRLLCGLARPSRS